MVNLIPKLGEIWGVNGNTLIGNHCTWRQKPAVHTFSIMALSTNIWFDNTLLPTTLSQKLIWVAWKINFSHVLPELDISTHAFKHNVVEEYSCTHNQLKWSSLKIVIRASVSAEAAPTQIDKWLSEAADVNGQTWHSVYQLMVADKVVKHLCIISLIHTLKTTDRFLLKMTYRKLLNIQSAPFHTNYSFLKEYHRFYKIKKKRQREASIDKIKKVLKHLCK